MARYLVLWKANPSAWPTDPKAIVDLLDGVTAGGDQLQAAGAISELGWFTPQEGFAIFDADSKDRLLGMIQGFFPFYSQEVHEIVPWQAGKSAILDNARQAASR